MTLKYLQECSGLYHIASNTIKSEEFLVFGNGTTWTMKQHANHFSYVLLTRKSPNIHGTKDILGLHLKISRGCPG